MTGVEDGDATITATSGSASTTASVTVEDVPGPFSLDANVNLVNLTVGEDVGIEVFALDVESVVTADATITVTGLETDCEQEINLTAEDQSKTIVVQAST